MPENENVDLTELNKVKRRIKLPRIKTPFKKHSAGPGRDAEGKFTSGSGGLLSNNKFNYKRVLPVVLVVALVGGFFVFRSFAAVTKPPKYQYSVRTCANKKITASDVQAPDSQLSKCVDESAEALSYRLQQAALGRQTDWGYNTLPQRLAGDRNTTAKVSQTVEALPEARWGGLSDQVYVERVAGLATPAQRAEWTRLIQQKKLTRDKLAENVAALFKISKNKAMMNSYRFNNKQFVEHIFKKLLKRPNTYSASSSDYWLKQLDQEKMSRAQVLNSIAQSQEAKNKSRVDVVNYVNSKPKLKIVQTAKSKQDARNRQLAALVSSSKTHFEKGAQHHQIQASKLVGQARNQAAPRAPSRAALTTIANLQKQAENHRKYAQQSASGAQNDFKKAESLLKAAKEVAKYSPDISSATAESSRNKVAWYAGAAKGKVNDINKYVSQIAASYKSAEQKYEAEQRRIAEEAARRERERQERANQQDAGNGSGSGSGGSSGDGGTPNYAAMEFYKRPEGSTCVRNGSHIFRRDHGKYVSCHDGLGATSKGTRYNVRGACPAHYKARWKYSDAKRNGVSVWDGVVCVREDKASTIGLPFSLQR